jgi:two-component sensor histidine kinase
MSDQPTREPEVLHQFKNHLSIVVSYADLLMMDVTDDVIRKDIAEIHKAAQAALALLPILAERLR